MKNIIRMLLSAITASGIFLLLFLLLKWDVIVSALLSVGAYTGMYLVLKPQRKLGEIDVELLRGGEEMQRLLDDARNDLDKMQNSTSEIKDSSVQSDAYALCDTGERIYVYLNGHPRKNQPCKEIFYILP
ncbi:MAG: 5-bromo-4-chloroindolyl phosphate hydrolysis family protein [Clostridia bacterium]|nr:5-bromo-4-chloroindolyl phosphate hydrolysis family protein [Clostridia bacterium]